MNLDVTLYSDVRVRPGPSESAKERVEWYTANITHNLGAMAREARIYEALWRPEEARIKRAYHLIEPLERGLLALKATPSRFKKHNPENGWGDYEGLVKFTEEYLEACKKYPEAKVSVWR